MGRPVNKRKFGDPVTTAGNQFYIQADIGAGEEQCFIVKQRATKRFRVESVASGNQLDVILVNGPSAVTGAGYGYIEAGSAGSNQEANSAVVTAGGSGYSVADVLTLGGATAGTAATFNVGNVAPIAGDEIVHATFVGGDGVGGTAYVVSDTITMSDGSVVTVDAIDANDDVTQFTLVATASVGVATDTATLTQASTSGTGTGFTITLAVADQAVLTITLATEGSMTAIGANPVATTGGTGTLATLTVAYSSIDDAYVAKLSNKNLIVHGGTGRDTYLINDASKTRYVSGE